MFKYKPLALAMLMPLSFATAMDVSGKDQSFLDNAALLHYSQHDSGESFAVSWNLPSTRFKLNIGDVASQAKTGLKLFETLSKNAGKETIKQFASQCLSSGTPSEKCLASKFTENLKAISGNSIKTLFNSIENDFKTSVELSTSLLNMSVFSQHMGTIAVSPVAELYGGLSFYSNVNDISGSYFDIGNNGQNAAFKINAAPVFRLHGRAGVMLGYSSLPIQIPVPILSAGSVNWGVNVGLLRDVSYQKAITLGDNFTKYSNNLSSNLMREAKKGVTAFSVPVHASANWAVGNFNLGVKMKNLIPSTIKYNTLIDPTGNALQMAGEKLAERKAGRTVKMTTQPQLNASYLSERFFASADIDLAQTQNAVGIKQQSMGVAIGYDIPILPSATLSLRKHFSDDLDNFKLGLGIDAGIISANISLDPAKPERGISGSLSTSLGF